MAHRRRFSALVIAVLVAVVPTRARAEPEPTTPTTEETQPQAAEEPTTPPSVDATADVPGDGSPSTTDAIHAELVRQFTTHFQQGRMQANRGNYSLAAAEFEKAFAAIPAEAALRNAVATHERAGELVAAATAAKAYLALPECGTPDVDAALCCSHRADVASDLERLAAQLGALEIKVAKGVGLREIRINGRQRARADFPLWVAPGSIDVELVGTKSQRRQRVIEVRAGETQTIEVDGFDTPVVGPDPGGGPQPGEGRRGRWQRPLFFAGVGVTAASGIALIATGALALVAKRDFEHRQQLFLDNPPEVDEFGNVEDPEFPFPYDARAQHRRYRAATNILVGVTGGLAVITAIVGIAAFRRRPNGAGARASTSVRWWFGGTGLRMRF